LNLVFGILKKAEVWDGDRFAVKWPIGHVNESGMPRPIVILVEEGATRNFA